MGNASGTQNITTGDIAFSIFTWYKSNTVARFHTIADAQTVSYTLYRATSNVTFEFMSIVLTLMVRKLATGNVGEQSELIDDGISITNDLVFRPTTVGFVIYVRKAIEPQGVIDLRTPDEEIDVQHPLFSLPNNVIDGGTFTIQTPQQMQFFFTGYSDSNFPGPIGLNTGDTIEIAMCASDNFFHPLNPSGSTIAMLTGNFNYQLDTPLEQINPSSMISAKRLREYQRAICIDSNNGNRK